MMSRYQVLVLHAVLAWATLACASGAIVTHQTRLATQLTLSNSTRDPIVGLLGLPTEQNSASHGGTAAGTSAEVEGGN